MTNKSSRRKFIVSSLISGVAAGLLPSSLLANKSTKKFIEGVGKDRDLVFLFQGDSITDGNRGRTADPNHVMGHGYAFAIASRVGADFPASGFTFFNRGVSGNTVGDLQRRWQTDTLDIKPDVLSVLIGINDASAIVENKPNSKSVDEFETGYRELLNEAKSAKPATIFVLGLPFVYPVSKRKDNWEQWKDEATQRADRVKKLAKEFDAILIDYPAVFDKAALKAPIDYWIWDGIHPTVAAHELMAREWIKQTSSRLTFLKKYLQ